MSGISDTKLIRDALGSPVPQYLNLDLQMFAVQTLDGSTITAGDMDFSKTKLLRDKLGSVIPQVWDAGNHKWTVVTSNGGNGEVGPVTWASIQDKPVEFMPSGHTHEISEISGLQGKLDELWAAIGIEPEEPEAPTGRTYGLSDLTSENFYTNGVAFIDQHKATYSSFFEIHTITPYGYRNFIIGTNFSDGFTLNGSVVTFSDNQSHQYHALVEAKDEPITVATYNDGFGYSANSISYNNKLTV